MKNSILKFKKSGLVLAAVVLFSITSTNYSNGTSMNNSKTKKTTLMLLSIVTVAITMFIFHRAKAEQQTSQTKNVTIGMETAQTPDTQEEQQFLATIFERFALYVNNIDRKIDAFLSKKNNQPYALHLMGFQQELNFIQNDIIEKLKREIASGTISSAHYATIIQQTHTILVALQNHLLALFNILKKHQATKNPIMLGLDLRKLEGPAKKQLITINKQTEQLYKLLCAYNPKIAQQVQALQTKLNRLNNKDGGLGNLMHRTRC